MTFQVCTFMMDHLSRVLVAQKMTLGWQWSKLIGCHFGSKTATAFFAAIFGQMPLDLETFC
jgi:hypothetical protein